MGQTRWKYHAFIDHLRPVRLIAALRISPGSTEHSRSPGDTLPVPNHDESAAALHREGDRLRQLQEMGAGSAARSEGAWKASKTTCRYHLNTKCRSARIGQNKVVWTGRYVFERAIQFQGKPGQLNPSVLCPPGSATCISMPSPLRALTNVIDSTLLSAIVTIFARCKIKRSNLSLSPKLRHQHHIQTAGHRKRQTLPNDLNLCLHIDYKPNAAWNLERKIPRKKQRGKPRVDWRLQRKAFILASNFSCKLRCGLMVDYWLHGKEKRGGNTKPTSASQIYLQM